MGENRVVPKFPVAVLHRLNSTEPKYKSFQLDSNEVTFGRSKGNSFVIQDKRLSRKHAVFRMNNGKWIIESVGMNCVWVNNIKMEKNHQIPLHNLDTINFTGDNQFVYAFQVNAYAFEENEEPVAKKMRFPLADLVTANIN